MKYLLLILIFASPVLAFNQSRDTVFTVKALSRSVKIEPDIDVLYQHSTYKFKLLISAETKIDTVIFSTGKCIVTDSLIIVRPSRTGTALLKVYTKQPGGKRVLAMAKQYRVVKRVSPAANLDGVNNDSAIHQMKAVAMGYLHLPNQTSDAFKWTEYKIISFEMTTVKDGLIDTIHSNGNRMTYEMRDRVDNMRDGGVLQFDNIRYLIGSDTLVAPALRVFLIRDDIKKF